jgi:hypothetical protein
MLPRRPALFGLVGGPVLFVSGIAVIFGAFDINSAPRFVCTVPEIIWEASIGICSRSSACSPRAGRSRRRRKDGRAGGCTS